LFEPLESRQLMSVTPFSSPTIVNGDPIQLKYKALGGAKGILGKATSAELATEFLGGAVLSNPQKTPSAGALFQRFANGAIFYSKATGVHDIYGAIYTKYLATAAMKDAQGRSVLKLLGLPTTDEVKSTLLAGGLTARFQGGLIDLMPSLRLPGYSPHVVYGGILAEYLATANETDANGRSVQKDLGMPLSDEVAVPSVPGARASNFQGGSIFWSPATGAHAVYGQIGAKYKAIGGPAAFGLPLSDESAVGDLPGVRVSNFTNSRSIFWSPATGAHTVGGDIGVEYASTINETDYYGNSVHQILGAPTSDEQAVPGTIGGRMNHFLGGNIYWSIGTGAHPLFGAIADHYNQLGAAGSYLGLPVSNEQIITGGQATTFHDQLPPKVVCYFENGKITWSISEPAIDVAAVSEMDFSTGYLSTIMGNPVDGWANLTVFADGTYHFQAHAHNSGFDAYSIVFTFTLEGDSGQDYVFTRHAALGGTIIQGSRDADWNDWGTYPGLANGWTDLEGGDAFYWPATVDLGSGLSVLNPF
jgi:uncharacterized protein with LGFP repeats